MGARFGVFLLLLSTRVFAVDLHGGPAEIPRALCSWKLPLLRSYQILRGHDASYKDSKVKPVQKSEPSQAAVNEMHGKIGKLMLPAFTGPEYFDLQAMARYAVQRGLSESEMVAKINAVYPLVKTAGSRASIKIWDPYHATVQVLELSEATGRTPDVILQQVAAMGFLAKPPDGFGSPLYFNAAMDIIRLCAQNNTPISQAAFRVKKGFEAVVEKYGADFWTPEYPKEKQYFHVSTWYPEFAKAAARIPSDRLFEELTQAAEGATRGGDVSVQSILYGMARELDLKQKQSVEFYNAIIQKLPGIDPYHLQAMFREHFTQKTSIDDLINRELEEDRRRAVRRAESNRRDQDAANQMMQQQMFNQVTGGIDQNPSTPW